MPDLSRSDKTPAGGEVSANRGFPSLLSFLLAVVIRKLD
jgi:hypothetical protein